MKQIRRCEEIEGKTITKVYQDSDNLWLGFSDNSFIILTIEHGYYDSTSLGVLTTEPVLLENTQAVLKLGIASVQKLAALEKERRETHQAHRENEEKAQLARLLAKYGK